MSVFIIVLPIFALIFAGWGARRLEIFGPQASGELNRFVVYLALPALLFDIVAKAQWSEIWQPAFVASFGFGAALVFAATVAPRLRGSRSLADVAIDGLNASYANTGFVGFPLALAVLGREGLAPTLIATILTVCVLFAVALVLIEIGVQAEGDRARAPGRMAAKVAGSLARNPLLVAPVLGALFLATDIALPTLLDSFLKLLGGAASPCALVALGLFLGESRETAEIPSSGVVPLVALKLVGQPLVTGLLASRVFHLSPLLTHACILLAGLPTGTGPFMVAEFYRREAGVTSRVVLASTVLSLGTITLYLALAL